MDLASAYNKLQPKVVKKQPRTSLAIKSDAKTVELFQQAVPLIEPNKWLKASPCELRKEDYYFYLKFTSSYDPTYHPGKEKLFGKNKVPIFAVEKKVRGNDVFQYRNQKGELDMYIRPRSTQQISGFDCSDCFNDKEAWNKFKECLPNESWVMKNLYGEQEHVYISFSVSDKDYSVVRTFVLFKDGNAYFFSGFPNGTDEYNPYLYVADVDLEFRQATENALEFRLASTISGLNKYGGEGQALRPVEDRRHTGACDVSGYFVDYFVYYQKTKWPIS